MTHPGTDTLLAHIDGELTATESRDLATHLSRCTTCFAAVAGLRETSGVFGDALRTIDEMEPVSWRAAPARSTEELVFAARRSRTQSAARAVDMSWLRRAAVFVLVTAATGSAAVIGGRALLLDREPAGTLSVEGAPAGPTIAAVSITPANSRVDIALNAAAGVRVQVVFGDDAEAHVAVENATAPHVTVAGSRVSVDVSDSGALVRITLPAALRRADVTSGSATLIRVRDGIVSPASAAEGGIVIGGSSQSVP